MARFRVAKGKLLVLPPGGAPVWEDVNLIFDTADNKFGIQATTGQLAGHCFFVSQQALKDTRDKGTEVDKLKSV